MGTIPISQLVQVNPGVLAAAGSAIDLNGLVVTDSDLLPTNQAVAFASEPDVSDYFGPTSVEQSVATVYFNGPDNKTRTPGTIYFFRYATAAAAGFLRSASLASVSLSALQEMTGDITISIDGQEATAAGVSFSEATSFSDAASMLETALSGTAVEYDGRLSAFTITSLTSGADSSVGYATGSLADSLRLTQSQGATASSGSAADTPATIMPRVVNVTQNWGVFMTTFEPELEDKQAYVDWTNDQGDRFAYAAWDSDVRDTQSGSTGTLGEYLLRNQPTGTVPVYADSPEYAAFVLGFAASLDFNRLNGRATMAWKSQSGLAPMVEDASAASALLTNGYNFYGIYANAKETFNLFQPGSVSGNWDWLDTYLNQIWLNANLQLAMVELLRSVGSVPYNADGDGLIYAACLDPILAALNFGAIRTGVLLSESQAQQIRNALGVDARQTIQEKGFYLQTKAADTPASVRAERGSPSCTLYYTDGGSIQSLNLASIAIQ